MNDDRFDRLLRGHANGDLVAAETEELRELAARDVVRAASLRALDGALALFADERALRTAVLEPVTRAADVGESYDRLLRRAAECEAELRAKLVLRPRVAFAPARSRLPWVRAALVVAAAVLLVALALVFRGGNAPALLPGQPDDQRAGGAIHLVLLDAELSATQRELSWGAVPGADGYDVVVVDGTGNVVLRRDPAARRSTAWELTTVDYAALLAKKGPVRIRVLALDGAGIPIGSSGERDLRLR